MDPGDGSRCHGKCDDGLQAVAFEAVVDCQLRPDSTADSFFRTDQVECKYSQLPDNTSVEIESVYVTVKGAGRRIADTGPVEAGDFGEDYQSVASIRGTDRYPVEVHATVVYLVKHHVGQRNHDPQETRYYHGLAGQLEQAPEAGSAPVSVLSQEPPFQLWEIALWPGEDVAAAWSEEGLRFWGEAIDYDFEVDSDALSIGGPDPMATVEFDRNRFYFYGETFPDVASLASLRGHTIHLLVPKDGFAEGSEPVLEFTLGSETTESPLPGPGYYVIGADGTATPTAVEDLPGEAAEIEEPDADQEI